MLLQEKSAPVFGQKLAKICLIGVDENLGRKCRLLLGGLIFNECCILSERIPHDNCIAYLKKSQCFLIFQQDTTIQVPRKLFEYLASIKGIEKIRTTKNNVTFVMSKEASRNINGEYLFAKANDISKFIRFKYRLEQINIILDTIKLSKHYLYLIVDLLEVI